MRHIRKPVIAYLLVNVRPQKEYDIAKEIEKFRNIKEVTITYGLWDIVVKVRAPSLEELDKIVHSIRQINGVERTTTLIGV